jgi:hypothetical protein
MAAPSELPVMRLQLENMELNLQTANEEMKLVRMKCDKKQSELVDAQMEVVRSQRTVENLTKQLDNMERNLQNVNEEIRLVRMQCDKKQGELVDAQMEVVRSQRTVENLSKQISELHVRAKQADAQIKEVEEEIKIVTSEHTAYARMVFRLSKRSCTLLQRWSNFPSAYSSRACFCSWVAAVRRMRLVRKFMDASAFRRRCRLQRATLYTWLRRAAGARKIGTSKQEEPSLSGNDDVRHALGVITNIISSAHKMRSHHSSPLLSPRSGPPVPAVRESPQGSGSAATNVRTSQAYKNGPQPSRAPLDNLQRLKNAYNSLSSAGGTSSNASLWNSPDGSTIRGVGKDSADDTGPLAWFLQVLLIFVFRMSRVLAAQLWISDLPFCLCSNIPMKLSVRRRKVSSFTPRMHPPIPCLQQVMSRSRRCKILRETQHVFRN